MYQTGGNVIIPSKHEKNAKRGIEILPRRNSRFRLSESGEWNRRISWYVSRPNQSRGVTGKAEIRGDT